MDGDGYDFFSQNHGPSVAGFNFLSQGSASGGAYDSTSEQQGVDLNSQALPAGEEFPYLADYGHFIQSGIASHGGQQGPSSRVHAQRPPHTLGVRTPRVRGRGGGMGAAAAGRGRQVNLIPGRSSTGAGGGFGCAPARSAGGRVQHAAAVGRVSGRHRTRACAGHAAAASTVLPQATPTDNYVNLDGDDDESYTYDDHGSSGDHSEAVDDNGGNDEVPEEDGYNEDSTSSSSSEDELLLMVDKEMQRQRNLIAQLVPIFGMYYHNHFHKLPYRVAKESGLEWVQRKLCRAQSCYNMFRVEPPLFHRLHNTLVGTYGLKSTSRMTSLEALGMFLWIVGAPQSVRQAEDRFTRSLETVTRTFNRVLTSVLKLADDIIKPKDPEFSTVHPFLENTNFWPHFNDCIGALDGTHVKVIVPKSLLVQHMNRHNETSQNVLAVCDFDMRFTFALAGWPGSVHDMRVFTDATTKYAHNFPHPPPGKHYMVDAGYANRPEYLAPYRCTRYHVEQWQNGPPPEGMKEIFNHAHSQVRNVIERSFGVLKMKWRILLSMPKFSTRKQARIIIACMALHNFIRESRIADREFERCDRDANYFPMPPSSSSENVADNEPVVQDTNMNDFRDELAHALYYG